LANGKKQQQSDEKKEESSTKREVTKQERIPNYLGLSACRQKQNLRKAEKNLKTWRN
jgi:hypothetical protein